MQNSIKEQEDAANDHALIQQRMSSEHGYGPIVGSQPYQGMGAYYSDSGLSAQTLTYASIASAWPAQGTAAREALNGALIELADRNTLHAARLRQFDGMRNSISYPPEAVCENVAPKPKFEQQQRRWRFDTPDLRPLIVPALCLAVVAAGCWLVFA